MFYVLLSVASRSVRHAMLHASSRLPILASVESALDAITTGATVPQSIPAVVAPAKSVMVL